MVARDGSTLNYFTSFHEDREICLMSVRFPLVPIFFPGSTYQFATSHENGYKYIKGPLADDPEVITEALKHDLMVYMILPERHQMTYARSVLSRRGKMLELAPVVIRKNRELVLLAVQQCPEAFKFAWKPLRDDREIATSAVSRCGSMILHSGFRGDPEMMALAVNNDPKVHRFLTAPGAKRRRVQLSV